MVRHRLAKLFSILDGNFEPHQVAPGQLAEFNMFDYEMSLEKLNADTCGDIGTVASMDSLKEEGSAVKSHKRFIGCKGNTNSNRLKLAKLWKIMPSLDF